MSIQSVYQDKKSVKNKIYFQLDLKPNLSVEFSIHASNNKFLKKTNINDIFAGIQQIYLSDMLDRRERRTKRKSTHENRRYIN